jgi:hypothetical protein
VDGRQYLLTAKHIVANFPQSGAIEIFHHGQWKPIKFALVGHASGNVDISVLAAEELLSPLHPLPAGTKNMIVGQTVYFCGFPYGFRQDFDHINNNFPLPLVKSGTLSGMMGYKGASTLFIDGHNNPGFSGGPIVYIPNGRPMSTDQEYHLAGKMAGFPKLTEKVLRADGADSGLHVISNPGIGVAFDIKYALELIQKNPVGLKLG